jgi:Gins51-like protein
MNPQEQEKIYLTLLRTWSYEIGLASLTHSEDQKDLINDVRELVKHLKTQLEKSKIPEVELIFKKSIENIEYMLRDFLEMRAEKILILTKSNQKIEEQKLLPIETDYYRGLYSAFKGYSKTSKLYLNELELKEKNTKVKPSTNNSNQNLTSDHEDEIISIDLAQIHNNSDELNNKNPEENDQDIKEIPNSENSGRKTSYTDKSKQIYQTEHKLNQVPNSKKKIETSKLKYIQLHVLEEVPAFVGADFEIYGPLHKEDIIYLPKKNGEILIEEKVAKLMLA